MINRPIHQDLTIFHTYYKTYFQFLILAVVYVFFTYYFISWLIKIKQQNHEHHMKSTITFFFFIVKYFVVTEG